MRKIIATFIGLCLCVGALHAQTPIKGLTVTGAYDTMRTVESTPRFVSPTGELYWQPVMTMTGEVMVNIAVEATNDTVCDNSNVTYTAKLTNNQGSAYSYEWTMNGTIVSTDNPFIHSFDSENPG